MAAVPVIHTERLCLRGFTDDDRAPFAALNADEEVSRFLSGPMTTAQSDALVDRIIDGWGQHGFGLWAVEPNELGVCVGFVGIVAQTFPARFTPCVEVGWRLARDVWGRGYAPEAAAEALRFGFERVGLDEIVSMTAEGNTKSRRVMEKLGMTRDAGDDFDHPNVPPGSSLRAHVLYRLSANTWRSGRGATST